MDVLKIKAGSLTKYIIIMPFLFATFLQLLHFPALIKYTIDVCWILLLVFLARRNAYKDENLVYIMRWWIICYFLYTLLLYIVNYQSLIYYAWGVRNNFRFYVFFFACIYFLKKEDVKKYLRLFDWLFWIDLVVTLIQFFGLGYRQDLLGGIFGTETGSNGYTNIFLVIIIAKSIVGYLHKKESLAVFVAKLTAAILMAAMAELKFFYVELVIIIAIAVLQTGFSWKKIVLVVVFAIAVYMGLEALNYFFPSDSNDSYTILGLIEGGTSTTGYTGTNDFNRLTGVTLINNNFLTTIPQRLFGYGLGNCDSNLSYSFLITPFAQKYAGLHYGWFMLSFSYLETGMIGLTFLFGFFVLCYIFTRRIRRKYTEKQEICQLAMIVAVCSIVLCIYNASLRTEAGYMVYFILALPFINQTKFLAKE